MCAGSAYLLLLHELGVRAIVDNIGSEDWSGKAGIDLLSVDILKLSVQNELVSLGANIDGGLLAEKDESEDVAVLVSVLLKETVWVHAISDGVTDDWKPVEDKRRLIWVLKEQLAQDVENDGESDEGGETSKANSREPMFGDLLLERWEDGGRKILENTHDVVKRSISRAMQQVLCRGAVKLCDVGVLDEDSNGFLRLDRRCPGRR